MHQIFITLMSLVVSLLHHASFSPRTVEAAELSGTVVSSSLTDAAKSEMILPDRYQLAHFSSGEAGYAGSACSSCRHLSASPVSR